jgi:hypothetical protein
MIFLDLFLTSWTHFLTFFKIYGFHLWHSFGYALLCHWGGGGGVSSQYYFMVCTMDYIGCFFKLYVFKVKYMELHKGMFLLFISFSLSFKRKKTWKKTLFGITHFNFHLSFFLNYNKRCPCMPSDSLEFEWIH